MTITPVTLHQPVPKTALQPTATASLRFGNRYEPPGGKLDDSILGLKPKPKQAVLNILTAPANMISRFVFKIRHIDVEGAEKIAQAVKAGHHMIITPNHPGQGDVFTVLKLAKATGSPMCFMAANWIFKTAKVIPEKWRHNLLTSLGAFPVNTDVGDKNSVNIAENVVAEGKFPLMMFPEGILAWQSRKVAYLNPGAAKIAIAASLSILEKEKATGIASNEKVLIFPTGIVHQFNRPILGKLDKHLRRLEKQLKLELPAKGTPTLPQATERTEKIWSAILTQLEQKYLKTQSQPKPLAQQHPDLIEAMFSHMEKQMDITPTPNTPYLRREKAIRMALVTDKPIAGHTFADEAERRKFIKATMLPELDCAFSLQKLTTGYMHTSPSQDRVAETLFALDRLLNDESKITTTLGSKTTTIQVGDPIDVSALVKANMTEAETKGVIKAVLGKLHDQLQTMLDAYQ